MRLLLILSVMLALSACQLALPGRGGAPDAPKAEQNPIVGGDIAVTTLDGPAAKPDAQKQAAVIGAPAKPGDVEATKAGAVAAGAEAATAKAADKAQKQAPEPGPEAGAKADPASASDESLAAEPAEPVAVKSAAQLACEKRKGRWSIAGAGSAAFCQTPTKDSGKVCRSSDDCTGYCLAKSNTCAPVTPMLGCHDILNEAGRMLTQCIN